MSEVPQPPPPPDYSQDDIRDLLEDIRRQNIILRRYILVLGVGVGLLLLMQSPMFSTIINYAVIVIIVVAVLLTAPMWSQFVVSMTDRIPWYPKDSKKRTARRDSTAGPV